jgi:peptide/nickel transport system substrate-binding protein
MYMPKAKLHIGAALVVLALTVASVAALLAIWGSKASGQGATSSKIVLRAGYAGAFDNLNPFVAQEVPSLEVFHLNYDYLTGIDPKTMSPRPELAVSWQSLDGGKVWIFNLRKNVKWQDGEPFTADDVVFTIGDLVVGHGYKFSAFTTGIEKVEAVDAHTVRITCTAPKADILRMCIPIVPKHIWDKYPIDSIASTHVAEVPFVGTGPFQVVEAQLPNQVRMVANKDYWGGRPKVDELVLKCYSNTSTIADDLRTGALDCADGFPGAALPALQADSDLKAMACIKMGFEHCAFNCSTSTPRLGNPVLLDVNFRRALQYAIDHEQIAKTPYDGHADPGSSLLRPGMLVDNTDFHWQPPADKAYYFDLKKAGDLLTAAGYPLKNGVRLNKDGKPIDLRLFAVSGAPEIEGSAKLIATWLSELGLKIDLKIMDSGALLAKVFTKTGDQFTPDYDMYMFRWSGVGYDPQFLLNINRTASIGVWNDCFWSNKEYDSLFAKETASIDPKVRQKYIFKMQEIQYDQAIRYVTVYNNALQAWNTAKWKGWVQTPANTGTVLRAATNIDSFVQLEPLVATATGTTSSNTGLIAGIVAAAVVAVGAVIWFLLRRRARVEEF